MEFYCVIRRLQYNDIVMTLAELAGPANAMHVNMRILRLGFKNGIALVVIGNDNDIVITNVIILASQ